MLSNKITQPKRYFILFIIVLIASVLGGCVQRDQANHEEIAATYKDGKVTQAELNKFISTLNFINPQQAETKDSVEFKEYVLKQLAMTKILNVHASEQVKSAVEIKVRQQIDPVKNIDAQQKTQLDNNLKAANLSIADVEQYFRMTFTAVEEMSSKVTDEQLKDTYDKKLKEDPNVFTIATVDHILIAVKDPADPTMQKEIRTKEEALKRANEVKEKLSKGGDFAALAKEYSDDPGSRDKGGKYENADINHYVPEFKKAAAELPLNQISEPVETVFGYHIIKVDSRTIRTLEQMKESIRIELANGMLNDFMAKDFASYNYQSNLPSPKK